MILEIAALPRVTAGFVSIKLGRSGETHSRVISHPLVTYLMRCKPTLACRAPVGRWIPVPLHAV